MKLLRTETTKFIILLIIILIEIIVIIYKDNKCETIPKSLKCSQAFNCKVDENNTNIANCNYIDENGITQKIQCKWEADYNE
ncbi:MAG: hypothetical protein E7161_05000 [Firmicutes bacterium]|nr:hypothetical protein [Bacillota bacterium]